MFFWLTVQSQCKTCQSTIKKQHLPYESKIWSQRHLSNSNRKFQLKFRFCYSKTANKQAHKNCYNGIPRAEGKSTCRCEKCCVTIGALARPIDSTRLPKRRPSDGTNPVHHCKASNIVKRHNHTEVQTTAAWATPCHGFILDPLSLRAERCISNCGD
jgi:hypothetical protein